MRKSASSLLWSKLKNEEMGHTIFNQSKQRFFSAVRWNLLESILYHVVFIAHQFGLYHYLGAQQYGKAGALFSFSFLCVTLLIGALDTALIAHISMFTSSKEAFNKLIKQYIFPHCTFMLLAPLLLLGLKYSSLVTTTDQLTWGTTFLIGIFIGCEAVKKLLRHVLQLMFYNKQTAWLEVAGIIAYVTLFWLALAFGAQPTLYTIFVPFIFTSLITTIILIKLFQQKTNTLPTVPNSIINTKGLRINQLCAYINQISKSLFSSNFLVPLFALSSGFMEAGIVTLVNYTTHTLTFFVHKICTPAASALFGHTTFSNQKEQQDAFLLTIKLFFSIITLTFSILGLYGWINLFSVSYQTLLYAGFFFAVHTLEHLFTLYEKFFIAQQKGPLLATLNIISCLISGYTFWAMHNSSLLGAITVSFSLRMVFIIVLSCIIFSPKNTPILSFFKKRAPKTAST